MKTFFALSKKSQGKKYFYGYRRKMVVKGDIYIHKYISVPGGTTCHQLSSRSSDIL